MKVAIATLLLVAPTVVAADYEMTYDRFKDQTTYAHSIKLADGMPDIDWSLDVTTDGQRGLGSKDTASLKFVVTYKLSGAGALDCVSDIASLVDGKPATIESAMRPLFYGGYAIATYEQKMPIGELTAFANAKSVEYRICGREYKLTDTQLAEIRGFVDFASKPE